MNFIILGPPGAGKGTQATLLSKNTSYGLIHISTGEIFREIIGKNLPLALKIKKYVESGELVPDDLVMECVKEKLKKGSKNGWLFDGIPRNIKQVKLLEEMLELIGQSIDAVIFLKLEDEEVIKRLSNRRVCPVCKQNYNLETLPPINNNLCDTCKVELICREDDKPEAIKKRLKIYYEETKPILEHYKKILIEIDGSGNVEEVNKKIKCCIESLLAK